MDNNNLSNDFEVRQATLVKLGGDPTNLSNIYEVDLAILEKTGQGGGGGAQIDDNNVSTRTVWSSSKTQAEDASLKNYVDSQVGTINVSLNTIIGHSE